MQSYLDQSENPCAAWMQPGAIACGIATLADGCLSIEALLHTLDHVILRVCYDCASQTIRPSDFILLTPHGIVLRAYFAPQVAQASSHETIVRRL